MNKIKLTILLLLSMFFISCNISSAWATKSSASQSGILIGVKNKLLTAHGIGTSVDLYVNDIRVGTAPFSRKKTTSFLIDPKKFGNPPYKVILGPMRIPICPHLQQPPFYKIQYTGYVISVDGPLGFQMCALTPPRSAALK